MKIKSSVSKRSCNKYEWQGACLKWGVGREASTKIHVIEVLCNRKSCSSDGKVKGSNLLHTRK